MAASISMSKLREAFDARPQSEKAILAVLFAVVVGWGYLTFVHDPLRLELTVLEQRISSAQSEIVNLQLRQQRAEASSQDDPNRAARERLEELIVEGEAARAQLEALTGSVVTPIAMNRLLTDVLDMHPGLRLSKVENLPPEQIAGNSAAAGTAQSVYSHGLVLEFEGSYLSTLSYLLYLESLSENFYWDALSIVPTEWPAAHVKLELHTLSAEETFVGV